MKKIFAVLALVGVMTSCKDKKKDEKKPEETTTTTITAATGVPTFSDPEVQKFANDYGAFMAEYRAGMKDPAKLAELSKSMTDWSTRAQSIGMKLASTPDEAKKWADWALALSQQMMETMK
ncbi:MAG: hypothetical protein SGI96_20480 [Bacteroidota bacterium]|nr:hypothetical protein [Bacteroidota bacterium]